VRGLLPGEVPPSTIDLILGKADGNPLFLEEMCRTVRHASAAEALAAVPDTIEQILLARVKRLPEETRRVIEAAAVLGREFPPDLLEAVWSGSGSLEAHVDRLTDLEFLYRCATDTNPVYAFKHALTQQVAYDTLPPARRRDLHAAAGRAIEAQYEGRLHRAHGRPAS